MGKTITITKQGVRQLTSNDYMVTVKAVIKDELGKVLLEKDYSVRHDSSLKTDSIEEKLQEQINIDCDRVSAEQEKFKGIDFDAMISRIQTITTDRVNVKGK